VARRNARLALVEKVGAIVPSSNRLFAVAEVPGTDVIVIAYRLERRIDRKLITCADRNDYFLLPIASGLPAAEQRFSPPQKATTSLWFPCSQRLLDEVEEFSTRLASTGIEELKLAFVQEAKDEGINLWDYVYRRVALSAPRS
jgi:hypothetical protein